jgi:hypothetical protein
VVSPDYVELFAGFVDEDSVVSVLASSGFRWLFFHEVQCAVSIGITDAEKVPSVAMEPETVECPDEALCPGQGLAGIWFFQGEFLYLNTALVHGEVKESFITLVAGVKTAGCFAE